MTRIIALTGNHLTKVSNPTIKEFGYLQHERPLAVSGVTTHYLYMPEDATEPFELSRALSDMSATTIIDIQEQPVSHNYILLLANGQKIVLDRADYSPTFGNLETIERSHKSI